MHPDQVDTELQRAAAGELINLTDLLAAKEEFDRDAGQSVAEQ